MNIVPEKSFFGGTETFKIGKTTNVADKGTSNVVQNNDDSVQILGD